MLCCKHGIICVLVIVVVFFCVCCGCCQSLFLLNVGFEGFVCGFITLEFILGSTNHR